MVFIAALFIPALVSSGILPLVETVPAKVKATTFLLGADTTGQAFVFSIHPFAETFAAGALLDPHCLFQVIF